MVFSGTNSRKKRPISREFHGNFRGLFRWKTIGKERPILWELPEQISLQSDWFCADLRKVFKETRRSYSIYSQRQASYRNMKSYFTSKLTEHNKNKWKNQDIEKSHFTILVASSSIFFIQLHVVCLTFEILFTRFFIFLTSEAHLSALQSVFQFGGHSVFVVRTRNGLFVISWERAWTWPAHFAGFTALSFADRTVPKKIIIFVGEMNV